MHGWTLNKEDWPRDMKASMSCGYSYDDIAELRTKKKIDSKAKVEPPYWTSRKQTSTFSAWEKSWDAALERRGVWETLLIFEDNPLKLPAGRESRK